MHTLKHSTHNMGQTFGTYNISQVYINTNLQRKIVKISLPIILSECRTFLPPPPPPDMCPPYEKWHMRTSAPQAIDIGGHVPPN